LNSNDYKEIKKGKDKERYANEKPTLNNYSAKENPIRGF
jgi:hypothetical protein